jgi:hypothetical protein
MLVAVTVAMPENVVFATLTVPVVVTLYPWNTTLLCIETGVEGAREPTWAMTVFQEDDGTDFRYSPANQNVELDVGVGSVAAPK